MASAIARLANWKALAGKWHKDADSKKIGSCIFSNTNSMQQENYMTAENLFVNFIQCSLGQVSDVAPFCNMQSGAIPHNPVNACIKNVKITRRR